MVLDLIKRLAGQGVAVMVVSHNLNDVFEVADRIAILYLGHMVAEDDGLEVRSRRSVVDYMTSGQSARGAEPPGRPPAQPAGIREEGIMNEPTSGAGTPAEPQAGSVATDEPEETIVEDEALGAGGAGTTAPEVLADSLGEYLRAWGKRIRSGESGALPVVGRPRR